MMRCSRCGGEGEVNYGTDGLAYCNNCSFYGLNKQCWKCRMYLPATELQQFRGQFTCPYCIMDLRDDERRFEERRKESEYGKDRYNKDSTRDENSYHKERCERCGRETGITYRYNGMVLCNSCVGDAKKKWKDIGSDHPPMAMLRIKEERGLASKIVAVVERKISEYFHLLFKKDQKKELQKNKKEELELRLLYKPLAENRLLTEKEKLSNYKTRGEKAKFLRYNTKKMKREEHHKKKKYSEPHK